MTVGQSYTPATRDIPSTGSSQVSCLFKPCTRMYPGNVFMSVTVVCFLRKCVFMCECECVCVCVCMSLCVFCVVVCTHILEICF